MWYGPDRQILSSVYPCLRQVCGWLLAGLCLDNPPPDIPFEAVLSEFSKQWWGDTWPVSTDNYNQG